VPEPLEHTGSVEFAHLDGKVAVIRLIGRCSFQNSAYLEKAAEICERDIGPCSYVFDLDHCTYMDSTFLGALAGIALRQRRLGRGNLIAVNVPPLLWRTMLLLGLTHVLDIRERRPEGQPNEEIAVHEADKIEMSRTEQVAHMIQAHRQLIEVDSGNEVRFNDVLKYLEDSLARARAEHESVKDNASSSPQPTPNPDPAQ